MKKALIIFVRNPERGKVKTRLAARIGEDKALAVYRKLLEHTKQLALQAPARVFVFTTEPLQDDTWNAFTIEQQNGNDLGEKMLHAFATLFRRGYGQILIIGSDCPELSIIHLEQAFSVLDSHDVAIGPARDGGYYLLGMKGLHAELFKNKQWSTGEVFRETLSTINELHLSFEQLEVLTDVDEEADLPPHWLSELFI